MGDQNPRNGDQIHFSIEIEGEKKDGRCGENPIGAGSMVVTLMIRRGRLLFAIRQPELGFPLLSFGVMVGREKEEREANRRAKRKILGAGVVDGLRFIKFFKIINIF